MGRSRRRKWRWSVEHDRKRGGEGRRRKTRGRGGEGSVIFPSAYESEGITRMNIKKRVGRRGGGEGEGCKGR